MLSICYMQQVSHLFEFQRVRHCEIQAMWNDDKQFYPQSNGQVCTLLYDSSVCFVPTHPLI